MLKRFLLVLVTTWMSWGQIPQQLQIQAPPPSMVVGGNGVVVGGLGNSTHYYWIVAVYPIGSMVSNQGIYVRQAPDTLSSTNYITVSWSPVLGATSYTVLRTIQNKIPVGACGCMKVTGLTTTTYNDISNTRNAYNVPLNIPPSLGTISIDNIGTLSPTHASTNVPQTIFNLPLINNLPTNQITFSDGTVQSTAAGGGSGTVTSIGLLGTANQVTVTGASPITTSGSWTLSLPASISGVTNLTPGGNFTLTQNSVVPFTSVSSGAVVNTLFLSTGQVSINTNVGMGEFLVASTATTNPRGIASGQWSNTSDSARYNGFKSRGTQSSPTTIVTGDLLTRWSGWGYDGANFIESTSIIMGSTGTIAATRVPSYLTLSTSTDATPSVLTERMRIFSSGGVSIGNTTDPGVNNLSVTGNISVAINSNISTSGTGQIGFGGNFLFRNASNDYQHNSNGVIVMSWEGSQHRTAIGQFNIAISNPVGTLDITDRTPTTGATRVTIGLGAADSTTTTVFTIAGVQKFAGQNSTGAGSALLGANSPASTLTTPYTWITVTTSDGSTAYMPVWK